MARSPDGNTDLFDIVAGVLPGDTFAPYLFIICRDNAHRTTIELIFKDGYTLKDKSQEADDILQKLNRRRLCRWYSASYKYTCPTRIPAA